MNDQVDVDAILDRFREWLESARAEDANDIASSLAGSLESREFGIIDLIEEFTALRQEVKLQTKSSRGLSEQTELVKRALEQAIEHFRSVEPRESQAAWTAGKALAQGLADLDESLDRGQREIDRARRQIADLSPQLLEADSHELYRGRSWIHRRLLRPYHNQVIEVVSARCSITSQPFRRVLRGIWLDQKAAAEGHGDGADRADSLRGPRGRS